MENTLKRLHLLECDYSKIIQTLCNNVKLRCHIGLGLQCNMGLGLQCDMYKNLRVYSYRSF